MQNVKNNLSYAFQATDSQNLTAVQLQKVLSSLMLAYNELKSQNMTLDMSRGKPGPDQLELCRPIMDVLDSKSDYTAEDGTDCRNYGLLDGLPEAKRLMAALLDVPAQNVLVGGSSSLNMMYDVIARAMLFGVAGSQKPWGAYDKIKFLCPVPGYDRHFAICEDFGIEMVPVEMDENGPDMDTVAALVAADETIKGIWCVPKFSNPGGQVYSDEVVRRFAALAPKAKDFRIFWDNAYCVHELYDEEIPLLSLYDELKKTGREDMAFLFCSTSKISFTGAGLAAMAASEQNLAEIKKHMTVQTIGHDKINQLRHVRFFKDKAGILDHMKKHAAITRAKFERVMDILEENFGQNGATSWSQPKGGYFISFNTLPGCAKRTAALCKEAGITLTPAGAAYPYGHDPYDRNIRIAPTFPSLQELDTAARALCLCAKIAIAEKLLADL